MSLDSLPVEILEIIFGSLALEDLASLAQVSKSLNVVHNCDNVWYSGLTRSHPRLAQRSCRPELLRMQERYGGWRDTARARAVAARELVKSLDKMADYCHALPGLPDLAMERLRVLIVRHGPLFIRDALFDVLYPTRGSPDDNLARFHYARLLYREIQRDAVLLPMFRRFAALPPHRATLKEAAQLFSEWLLPEIPPPVPQISVISYYHQLASLVLLETRSRHPLHPITAWKQPREQPFADSSAAGWRDEEALQLLDIMNDVLYVQLRLMEEEEPQNPEDAALHRKLIPAHRGIGTSRNDKRRVIIILYVNVAGMLGMSLQMLQHSNGLLARCYSSDGSYWMLVDPCDSGRRYSKEEACQRFRLSADAMDTTSSRRMLQRIISQTEQGLCELHGSADVSALRLLSVYADADFQPSKQATVEVVSLRMYWRPMYARRQVQDRISQLANQTAGVESIQLAGYLDILQDLHLRQKRAVARANAQARRRLAYSQMLEHRFFVGDLVVGPTGERGVVYGDYCDSPCRACSEAQVAAPPLAGSGRIPPTYRLMVHGCKYRDMREDQLKLAEDPSPITHSELGRFFIRFSGGRYVPLPSLDQRKPARLSAHAQSRGTASNHQQDCGGSQEDRSGGESSGVEMRVVMEALPREVPDTWVGEWPEVHPDGSTQSEE